MACDYTFYPNYGPLSRRCRREGALRTCGHHLCDRHARRHEAVCMPPAPVVKALIAQRNLATTLRA